MQLAYSEKTNEIDLKVDKTFEDSMDILVASNNAYNKGIKSQRIISAETNESMYEKSSWSEEDEHILKEIISFIPYHLTAESYILFINWLKLLKNRVVSRVKSEWSEEDKNKLKEAISYIDNPRFASSLYSREIIVNWLKYILLKIEKL